MFVLMVKCWLFDELMEVCWYYVMKIGWKIFFEWMLIEGKNDLEENVYVVVWLFKGFEEL